jgi:predicted transcriptional regulator
MNSEDQSSIPFNLQLAVAIRSIRTGLGWSQADLAVLTSLSKPTIARIESLAISPRGDTIDALLTTFRKAGVDVEILSDEVKIIYKKNALFLAQGVVFTDEKKFVGTKKAQPIES